MTQYLQDPALWALIVGTPLAATAIIRGRKTRANLRQEQAELEKRAADLENNYAEAVQEAHNRAEEATKSALKSAMRTLQGLANEQQLAISKTQDKYGEHQLLQDLLEIDHMNSQFGRRAQSIAVLCDGWLGRQRAVASVYDVVRSAKGRIRHYTRVEIRSQSNFALVSRA
ncbi:ATP-binding protein, partial [Streptomyces rubiginosohelvolus]